MDNATRGDEDHRPAAESFELVAAWRAGGRDQALCREACARALGLRHWRSSRKTATTDGGAGADSEQQGEEDADRDKHVSGSRPLRGGGKRRELDRRDGTPVEKSARETEVCPSGTEWEVAVESNVRRLRCARYKIRLERDRKGTGAKPAGTVRESQLSSDVERAASTVVDACDDEQPARRGTLRVERADGEVCGSQSA
jgi:hypothetical protein